MFGNKPNETEYQAPSTQTTTPTRSNSGSQNNNKNTITAYLGPDTRIEGTLHFESSVLIEGQFKGTIVSESGQLVVGESACVEGDISGGHVTVRGKVDGSINASQRVHLADKGEFSGELTTPSLAMDESVTFDGTCHMTKSGKGQPADKKPAHENSTDEIVEAVKSVS